MLSIYGATRCSRRFLSCSTSTTTIGNFLQARFILTSEIFNIASGPMIGTAVVVHVSITFLSVAISSNVAILIKIVTHTEVVSDLMSYYLLECFNITLVKNLWRLLCYKLLQCIHISEELIFTLAVYTVLPFMYLLMLTLSNLGPQRAGLFAHPTIPPRILSAVMNA